MDSRPDGGLRDELDVSARLLYEAVDLRKTEPGIRDHARACIGNA
jgi:hypothetical protein